MIRQSPLTIGANEAIPYTVSFAGAVPTSVTALSAPVVTLHDVTRGEPGTDVSSARLSGTPTFADLVLTLPIISGLTSGHRYILRCRGTGGGGTYELWAEIRAE